MKIVINTTLQKFEGKGGWHHVKTTHEQYAQIRNAPYFIKSRGFGAVMCRVTVGKTVWTTSLFPTKEKVYILFVKKEVREKEQLKAGDNVKIRVEV